jgi:type II restriction enzyme
MTLNFNTLLAANYKSKSQIARVLTENWVASTLFCVRCGFSHLGKAKNNRKVADFICPECGNLFELKSKSGYFGKSIVDGDYQTMISKVTEKTNPDFLLLTYDDTKYQVSSIFAIPRHFFIPSMIQKRKPLPKTARRYGWVGCNILIDHLPLLGRVSIIDDGIWRDKLDVLRDFRKAAFLENESLKKRAWILDIMNCVNRIPSEEFSLDEVYRFEDELKQKHPDNHHIRPKIRQQLQVLRDKGILAFERRGYYKKI